MAGWGRKSRMVLGTRERVASKRTKNSTNEASMLLKTRNGCWNEAKKYLETKELYENTETKLRSC